MSKPSVRLKALGVTLPEVAAPVAAYIPFIRYQSLIVTSGQIPMVAGELKYKGLVGREQSVDSARDAARICAINALACAAKAAGNIDRVARVLRLSVFVAVAPDFTDAHLVANGASEFIGEVFGDAGKHARAAVGVATLPLNASVEVDAMFEMAETT